MTRQIVPVILALLGLAVSAVAEPTMTVEQHATSANEFAVKLYQQQAQTPGNLVMSPLSVHIALSTNGVRLPEIAGLLRESGLDRVNMSVDSLRQDRIVNIARRNLSFDPVRSAFPCSQCWRFCGLERDDLRSRVRRLQRMTHAHQHPARSHCAARVNTFIRLGARRRTRLGRAVTRALGRLATVVAVEAAALEYHPDRAEQFAQPTRALLARGQRIFTECLDRIEAIVALGAGIAVSRHTNLRDGLNA